MRLSKSDACETDSAFSRDITVGSTVNRMHFQYPKLDFDTSVLEGREMSQKEQTLWLVVHLILLFGWFLLKAVDCFFPRLCATPINTGRQVVFLNRRPARRNSV